MNRTVAPPAAPSAPRAPSAPPAPEAPSGPSIVEKGKEMLSKLWSEKMPLMIFIIVVVLVFVAVIVYISFALKNSNLANKVLISKPMKLNELATPFEVSGSDIPKPAVGREYCYSFWLYLESFEQTPDNNKLIWYRGNKDDVTSASPLVMMDSMENKLYFVIKTQDSSLTNLGTPAADLRNIVSRNYYKDLTVTGPDTNKHIIMEVDYVPLQRWVNIVVMVDNKIVTLFLDGEVYSVKSTDELKSLRKPELDNSGKPIVYNLIVDKSEGNIYVGRNAINNKVTVNGYISKIEFSNFAPSLNQIKSIYNAGPFSKLAGFLSQMGLRYTIRSPIVRIDQNK